MLTHEVIMIMADITLNQSMWLYEGDQLNNNQINNTMMDQTTTHSHSDLYDGSGFEIHMEEESKNNSNQKEPRDIEGQFLRNLENRDFKPKKNSSQLRDFLRERQRQKEILTFYCFGERKVEITRDQVQSFIRRKFGDDGSRQQIVGKIIIEQVIRKLCLNQFNFQPCFIKIESFNLVGIEVNAQGKRQIAALQVCLQDLYKFQSLLVSRVKKEIKLNKYYTELLERNKESEILEIISPDQRDLIEVIQRGKTYGELKQKLLSYYYQMIGKIVLVSYHNFKIIENKRKIGDISDKFVEIYQEKAWQFQDNIFKKRYNTVASTCDCPRLIAAEEYSPTYTEELLVSDSLIRGSLFLQVRKNHLVQRYHGGLLGYLVPDRVSTRSLMTLTAIKITQNCLYLQFKYKTSAEVVVYEFSSNSFLTELLKAILAVVRLYNHRVQVMD